MATQPTRARRDMKANTGRIIRTEQLLGRLEKRIEKLEQQNARSKAERAESKPHLDRSAIARLEKENANLKAELATLRARTDQTSRDTKQNAARITRLDGLREPVQALVRGFKATPGAPFEAWRMWMLSTFRKQGLYRRQLFR